MLLPTFIPLTYFTVFPFIEITHLHLDPPTEDDIIKSPNKMCIKSGPYLHQKSAN